MEFIKDPKIVGVISGSSTLRASIRNRPSHTIILKESGESIYVLRGKRFRLCAGTVLFIPEGESYSFKKISEGDSIYRLINFHAEIVSPEPKLFSLPQGENLSPLFKQMERLWKLDEKLSGKYEMLSLFYKLVSTLTGFDETKYTTSEQKESISSSIDYLEKHLFDSDLRISSLHDLCGMSAPTFRRIFSSRFGAAPRKYVIRQRLLQAKAILESGEYKTVSEVARAVGYDDPLYFSRHFKEFYGVSPSNF
jgi:AraC-like DNA-binding protein